MNLKENKKGQMVEKVKKNGIIIMLRKPNFVRKQAMESLLNYIHTHVKI